MRKMITEKNLIRHEIIGLSVVVKDASNPTQIGVSGRVVDETRDTLKIEDNENIKTIPKENTTFVFDVPSNGSLKVDGNIIKSRPEDRTGKRYKKW
ncbi:MAG: ribonuclease P protein component 1 [Candidatus Aenigmatarchaeota archaeon]